MQVKRITFERSGGFAGIHINANFKPEDLPKEEAEALSKLLEALDFDQLSEQAMNKPSLPDQFTYRITVETEDREYRIVTGDLSAPEKLQELLQMLNRIARKQARRG